MPTLMQAVERLGLVKIEIYAGVREHMETDDGGQMRCKLCGAKVPHPRAAAAHLAVHHRKQLEATAIEAREFSDKKRKNLAKSGAAMPGGGFPIVNREDLGNARQAIGRAKNPAKAKAHIRTRAKALGVKLPAKWGKAGVAAAMAEASERFKNNMAAWGVGLNSRPAGGGHTHGVGHRHPNPSHSKHGHGAKAGHRLPNQSMGRA